MHIPALNPTQTMPNSLNHRFFISCASNEFGNYRGSLREHLTTHVGEVKVQEDFSTSGGTLLEKLDDYVRHSSAVLHLIGDWAGSCAQPAEVQAILSRYPGLADALPELKDGLLATPCTFSYTQWECYLALYHKVPCYIYIADPASKRQPGYVHDAAQAASQAAHLARLVARGHDRPPLEFNNAQDVALSFLKVFYSALISTQAGAKDAALAAQEGLGATALMTWLGQNVTRQLDSRALANRAPGNISRSPDHFVGRQKELAELHSVLTAGGAPQGGRGMIVATFSPGGLGKTAFARQYAHVHADSFAAGGSWEVACEGTTDLGAALLRLADEPSFQALGKALNPPILLELEQAQKQDYRLAASAVLDYLHRVLQARADALRREIEPNDQLRGPAQFAPIDQPRALLLLDNVDQPALLHAHQTAQLPSAPWLTLVVTTRLNPQAFHLPPRSFHPIEISVLPAADALQLLRDFQPGQRFADGQEKAATEIVRLLGGYTLAVELVGAYLGNQAHQDYQPLHYLNLLKQKGLTSVDRLAQDDAVQAQVRHSTDVAQNHISTLIGWSQARLSIAARTALAFASLLMPDEIPLVWLEHLTQARHPAELAHDEHEPPKWPAIWRELHGLRLLHPAGELQKDARGIEQMPVTVRIHRLVASHVDAANVDALECFSELDHYIGWLSTLFERQVGYGEDADLKAQHPWLRDQLSHLIDLQAHPASLSLLRSAGVAASFEGQHGSLARALAFMQQIFQAQEVCLTANPESSEAARDMSASLQKLGDFWVARGQSGDTEQALGCFQRCLEISERLLVSNPESDDAIKNVSVSLNKLGEFLLDHGQSSDAQQVFLYCQRSLDMSEQLLAINPKSVQAVRDVSVSLNKYGDFLVSRGHPGDEQQALGCFQRSLEMREQLLVNNPQSTEVVRDVVVALERVSAILAARLGEEQDALALQLRALGLALQLQKRNSGSYYHQRTAAISYLLSGQRAQAAHNPSLADQYQRDGFGVLDALVNSGVVLDAPMRQSHAQLKLHFSKSRT
jgi:tetratricopeptide (TPR) repeat protein